jgi:hypothetical protein
MIEAYFSISSAGECDVSERSDPELYEHGTIYKTIELVSDHARDKVTLALSLPDDGDEWQGVAIDLSDFHVENAETGRAFHARVKARLTWEDVGSLYRCLGYLLSEAPGAR